MSKTIKLISALLIAVIMVMTLSNTVFAAAGVLNSLDGQVSLNSVQGGDKVATLAGRIISFIQYVAIIAGAVILAVLGIKYMMGSVEEKAEYKKSFVPLIVGIVVVMGAITIANVLFQTFGA